MFNKKTVRDVDIAGKTILLRTDYNVPLKDGKIVDDLRIRASLPTIEYLLEHGAGKIIIISHLGRPQGREESLSLLPVAQRLKELLPEREVYFNYDVAGAEVEKTVDELNSGSILLLENLRFWPEEKQNDASFAKEIVDSTRAELFVQDAFGAVHRAHTSTSAITKLLPSVAGLLLEKEVAALGQLTENPAHPFFVLIGGAKVADKEPLIEKTLTLADEIFVGGKIAADGYTSESKLVHVAKDFATDGDGNKLDVSSAGGEELAGFITREAATVLWNGAFGKTEDPEFAKSSEIIARAIGQKENLTSIICGGDTTAFVENLSKEDPALHFTLISTGGGAALSLLTGEPLPGLESLEDQEPQESPES